MSRRAYVVNIERIPNRYTVHWYDHIPKLFADNGYDVSVISPTADLMTVTPNAFFDFAATTRFKAKQTQTLIELERIGRDGLDGALVFFPDFWHPAVLQLAYLRDLAGLDIKLAGIAHAGSYDPHDFLSRNARKWALHFERSLHNAFDMVFVATEFHRDMYLERLCVEDRDKLRVTGFPMERTLEHLELHADAAARKRKKRVIFPHRWAPEKQKDIFDDLSQSIKGWEFVTTYDKVRSQEDFYTLLRTGRFVFSASLQETFGIAMIEGVMLDCLPMAPARLSYPEMYDNRFLYPEHWTRSYDNYLDYKQELISWMKIMFALYDRDDRRRKAARELQFSLMPFCQSDNIFRELEALWQ